MQRVKEKAIQLLKDGVVDRVIGWKAGEFFYDLTPAVFTSAEEVEKDFVWSVFSAANVSKYLIAESKKGGRIAAFLKPCDSYSFVQLCKEHRIAKENVYVVGVQCDGTCDIEKLKALGFKGVTGVEERGEELLVSTLYGEKTAAKKDALLERCTVCKSKRIAYFDELLGEQGEDCGDARFEAVEKLEAMTPEERFAFWRAPAKSASLTITRSAPTTRPLQTILKRISSTSSGRSTLPPAAPTAASALVSARSTSRCICSTASSSRTRTSCTVSIRPEPILIPGRR